MVRWSFSSRRERKRRHMGINCSTTQDDSDSNAEKDSQTPNQTAAETVRAPHHDYSSETMTDDRRRKLAHHEGSGPGPAPGSGSGSGSGSTAQDGDQYSLLEGYDSAIDKRLGPDDTSKIQHDALYENPDDYLKARKLVQRRQDALAFDFTCKSQAGPDEIFANKILQKVKKQDEEFFEDAPKRQGYGGQVHRRFAGDHFLSNVDLIEKTILYKISQKMPKGAHLHIHFNANLKPDVLINIAKGMDHMYIFSNIPLMDKAQGSSGFARCNLQFSIFSRASIEEKYKGMTIRPSLFDVDYNNKGPMPFKKFCNEFEGHYKKAHGMREDDKCITVDEWLQNKLEFQEEEAYNLLQTADGAWEKFNGRTQMMKGLFNYETAYRKYTTQCLQEFVDDNIQYAEIRPNFMSTNQVWTDDGSNKIGNRGIMDIIIAQYTEFQEKHNERVLKGLKIIYCTPRSFKPPQVEESLAECLEFKKHRKYGPWIAGFDLVGEESKGSPLKDFIPQFLEFKRNCASTKPKPVDIPFLFHCGETLDIGKETDGNLFDALLLGSKRIGHGFALPRHPYVMAQMKARGICVEVCPISNEILGLTPRINGHAAYNLLANNIPCTISTDNGTPFRSRLSHDFYQIMVGKSDMTLHGWRQLIEWSFEHSCMEDHVKRAVREDWLKMWEKFCKWIIKEYAYLVKKNSEELPPDDEDEVMDDVGAPVRKN